MQFQLGQVTNRLGWSFLISVKPQVELFEFFAAQQVGTTIREILGISEYILLCGTYTYLPRFRFNAGLQVLLKLLEKIYLFFLVSKYKKNISFQIMVKQEVFVFSNQLKTFAQDWYWSAAQKEGSTAHKRQPPTAVTKSMKLSNINCNLVP